MSRKKRQTTRGNNDSGTTSSAILLSNPAAYDLFCVKGYVPLDHNPEIIAGWRTIAELISSMTIHLMANTDKGDIRITNELSRMIDITPSRNMTRRTWMEYIVMNLLYGNGNSIVLPHTWNGYLEDLEPIPAKLVQFTALTNRDYTVQIDGKDYSPDNILHFVQNPDKNRPWKGQGLRAPLKDIVAILSQAKTTEKAFMSSEYKPSLVVKIDGLIDEFSNQEGRKKLADSYLKTEPGEPWMIPAGTIDIEQIKPLSLSDLAINETVELDKRTVAALLRVPPFVLGVGEYNRDSWNNFIANTIRPIALMISQELTKKLLYSPQWYFRFNINSLYDFDIQTVSTVYGALYDKGIVTGNEVRSRLSLPPLDGLDELRILENYIPADMSGDQKKLIQEDDK